MNNKISVTDQNKDTICAFPFEWYSVDTGFGWWRSCPRVPYQKLEDTNFHNHDKLLHQRQELKNGIQTELCNDCWNAQNCGAKSYRQVLERDYAHEYSKDIHVPVPKIIEIKFSNLCNLRCIFCNSKCSNLWEDEQPIDPASLGSVRGELAHRAVLKYIDDNYKDIQTFQLFGGEPVLHKEFDEIFQLILSKPESDGKKEISFSTNLYYNDAYRKRFEDNIEKCLLKGHKVFMRMSIDAVGERGEYLRQRMDWKRFEKNFDSIMERFHDWPNFGKMRCNIALNVTNILYLDEIMQYIDDRGYHNVQPHYNYVGNPSYFYVQTYGNRLQRAIDIIKTQDYRRYDKYKTHVIELLESMVHLDAKPELIENGKQWLNNYDNKVGKDFLTVFPLNEFMFND